MIQTPFDLSRDEFIELVESIIPPTIEYYEEQMDLWHSRIDLSFAEQKVLAKYTVVCIEIMNLEYWAKVAPTLATVTLFEIYNRFLELERHLALILSILENPVKLQEEITPMRLTPLDIKLETPNACWYTEAILKQLEKDDNTVSNELAVSIPPIALHVEELRLL